MNEKGGINIYFLGVLIKYKNKVCENRNSI